MSSSNVQEYYRQTKNSVIRPELQYALSLISGGKTAVDCGCGSGSNIVHLRHCGYVVHAFDISDVAISHCTQRFKDDQSVFISKASFATFIYPKSSLVLADASLFFCPKQEFGEFLNKTRKALHPRGIFCGAFLGARDTMAQPDFRKHDYWGDTLVQTEAEIREALSGFEILRWAEIEDDGVTPTGEQHHWHIYSVVARLI